MRNGAIKKKEEMGYKKQDTPYAGCGQAPGAASEQVLGSVSRGLCVKLQESRDKGWGQRGTGNRAGLDRCGWAGSPEAGRPGSDHPLESRLWVLVSGGECVGSELEAGVREMGGGEKIRESGRQRPGRERV